MPAATSTATATPAGSTDAGNVPFTAKANADEKVGAGLGGLAPLPGPACPGPCHVSVIKSKNDLIPHDKYISEMKDEAIRSPES